MKELDGGEFASSIAKSITRGKEKKRKKEKTL